MADTSKTIICLGDSITCNWVQASYVDIWQELVSHAKLPYHFINTGINGETAQDGYYRLEPDVISHRPFLVTILFGHNEIGRGEGIDHWEAYLNLIIQKLNHSLPQVKIWVLSPNRPGLSQPPALYTELLNRLALPDPRFTYANLWHLYDDLDPTTIYTYSSTFNGQSFTDYLHPNYFGHQIIAQELFHQLKSLHQATNATKR